MIALVIGLGMSVSVAHAQSFNNDSRDMATVLVSKANCTPGAVDGCWKSSITANPGDTIGVQIYYHNTSDYTAANVAVGLNRSGITNVSSTHTISGGVLANGYIVAKGSATVNLSSAASLELVRVLWYPNQSTTPQTIGSSNIYDNYGQSIGDVNPGWAGQGNVVIQYRVSGAVDNNSECRINDFTADDTSIDDGDSTKLRWDTTGCDYVNIDSDDEDFRNRSADGSVTVSPSDDTVYTLRAYRSDGTLGDSDTVRINVGNSNSSCSIDSFYADDTTIDRGDSTVLRWTTTKSGSVDIESNDQDFLNRNEDGNVTVRPSSTTTYTLTTDKCNRTKTVTVYVGSTTTNSAPQAITTVASVLGGYSAQLNGIAVPNTTTGSTTAWFEWGTNGYLGTRTASQAIATNGSNTYYNTVVSGLTPGAVYYYRAAVQNQNGTTYGDIVRFQTTRSTVVTTTPPRVTVKTVTIKDTVTAQSEPSLLELKVETSYDRMCVGGAIDYTITYRNVSSQKLTDTVLRITHPKEITYLSSSLGHYEVVDRALTLDLGSVEAGESGTIIVHARVNSDAIRGNLAVTTASVVYTNSITRAQEDAIAYSLLTISDDCPNLLGASAFGFGSFLPDTLLEWLLLILVILALILVARQFYKKREENKY